MWRNSKPYILLESESVSHSVRSDSVTGSSVRGILQERIMEWVAIPFSEDLPDPGIKPGSPVLQADSLPSEPPGKHEFEQTRVISLSKPLAIVKDREALIAAVPGVHEITKSHTWLSDNNKQCWWKSKMVQLESNMEVPQKLKIELPCDSAAPLLSIYSKYYYQDLRDISTSMLIEILLTSAKVWKHPKCPSTDEWIKKMEYHSVLRGFCSMWQHRWALRALR